MIELYHGSTLAVHEPKILTPSRTLDFGKGFYTTTDFEQALDLLSFEKEILV